MGALSKAHLISSPPIISPDFKGPLAISKPNGLQPNGIDLVAHPKDITKHLQGKRKPESLQAGPRQRVKWSDENMNANFANLQIQSTHLMNMIEGSSPINVETTVVTEERISVVRRQFIHIKRLARNKRNLQNSSLRIEELVSIPSDRSQTLTAEEASPSKPPQSS